MATTPRQQHQARMFAQSLGYELVQITSRSWGCTTPEPRQVGTDGATWWYDDSARGALIQAFQATHPCHTDAEVNAIKRAVPVTASRWRRFLDWLAWAAW